MTDTEFGDDVPAPRFRRPNEIVVSRGLTAASGEKYVQVTQNDKVAWVNLKGFSSEATRAVQELEAQGILLLVPKKRAKLRTDVDELDCFPAGVLAERPGWGSGDIFGYPNRQCFSPSGDAVPVAYSGDVVTVASAGTLNSWKRYVVRPVLGQHLPEFSIMAALAAPLLRLTGIQGNFGFMFSGPPRKGKTTCLDLAASVCGPALDGPHGRYSKRFSSTTHRLHQLMHYYGDLPFLIDEFGGVESRSARNGGLSTLVHLFAGVDARERFNDPLIQTRQVRCIFIITSNYTQRDLLAFDPEDSGSGVSDRLHELPVPRGDEGVFNAGFGECANYQALADEIRSAVGQHYGTAMPAFLAKLVVDVHLRRDWLVRGVERRMRSFAEEAQRRLALPLSSRALQAFGLVYAAGELAQRYRILPRELDCLAASLHCLKLNVGQKVEADPLQRLLSWALTANPRDLRGRRRLPDMSDGTLVEQGVFIGACNGQSQLWVSPDRFRAAFPAYNAILTALARREILRKDHHRRTVQCRVRGTAGMDRMYVFRGPEISDWLEANGYGERPVRRRV